MYDSIEEEFDVRNQLKRLGDEAKRRVQKRNDWHKREKYGQVGYFGPEEEREVEEDVVKRLKFGLAAKKKGNLKVGGEAGGR